MKLFMVLFLFEALVTLQVCSGQGFDSACPTCPIVPDSSPLSPNFKVDKSPFVRKNRYCEAFRRLPNPFYGGFCVLHGLGKREATRSKREASPKGQGVSILVTKLRK